MPAPLLKSSKVNQSNSLGRINGFSSMEVHCKMGRLKPCAFYREDRDVIVYLYAFGFGNLVQSLKGVGYFFLSKVELVRVLLPLYHGKVIFSFFF